MRPGKEVAQGPDLASVATTVAPLWKANGVCGCPTSRHSGRSQLAVLTSARTSSRTAISARTLPRRPSLRTCVMSWPFPWPRPPSPRPRTARSPCSPPSTPRTSAWLIPATRRRLVSSLSFALRLEGFLWTTWEVGCGTYPRRRSRQTLPSAQDLQGTRPSRARLLVRQDRHLPDARCRLSADGGAAKVLLVRTGVFQR
jgi:hypothetical protein